MAGIKGVLTFLFKCIHADQLQQYHFCGIFLSNLLSREQNPANLSSVKLVDGRNPVIDMQFFVNMVDVFSNSFGAQV